MKKITHIIIHCSDSKFGDSKLIDSWHKERGWSGIGYHFVILNGSRTTSKTYKESEDGIVERGRPLNDDEWISDNEIGSHALGFNDKSIGICLIGINQFTKNQLYSLLERLKVLIKRHKIDPNNILGHYEIPQSGGKTCPNFNVQIIRNLLTSDNIRAEEQINPKTFNFI